MSDELRHFDAFAGIGGWSAGFAATGIRTVAACEIDEWRREVYRQQFPDVRLYGDIANVSAVRLAADSIGRIDIISGSFPCQDISAANARGIGIDGERSGLVWELLRLCDEMRPRFLCAENSPRLRTRGYDRIADELERLGYACQAYVVSAGDIGAPHERERVWIVGHDAHADRRADHKRRGRGQANGSADGERDAAHARRERRRADLHAGTGTGAERQLGLRGAADIHADDPGQPRQPLDGLARPGLVGRSDRDAAILGCDGGGSAEASGRPPPEPTGDARRDGAGARSGRGHQARHSGRSINENEFSASPAGACPDAARPRPQVGSGLADDALAQLPPALRAWARGWPRWNGGVAGLAAAHSAVRAGELAHACAVRAAHPDWSDRRVALAVANRRTRLIAALGDGIVPDIAEAIGRAILHLDRDENLTVV